MDRVGQLVGSYRILGKIGEGGMGEVFSGLDEMLEREVAIKVLRPEFSRRQDIVERFRTEALALARLNHPNIVMLYNFFRQQDQYFMVLEFVRGETLDRLIGRHGAMPWRRAVTLVCQALEGLGHAHESGVVHRDIKPANMILSKAGTLKMMDFGIARILERARLTQTGHLFGTLEYMSPEQVQGGNTDARSDLYSAGAVLYELLTGHLPFERSSDYDLIRSHVEEEPKPPGHFTPHLPPSLEATVLRALSKTPQARFQSAGALRAALATLLSELPACEEAKPDSRQAPANPPSAPPSISLSPADPTLNPAQENQESVRPVQKTTLIKLKRSSLFTLKPYPEIAVLLVLLTATAGLIGATIHNNNRFIGESVIKVEKSQAQPLSKAGLATLTPQSLPPDDSALINTVDFPGQPPPQTEAVSLTPPQVLRFPWLLSLPIEATAPLVADLAERVPKTSRTAALNQSKPSMKARSEFRGRVSGRNTRTSVPKSSEEWGIRK